MTVIKIKGMSCQHCVALTKEALEKIPGISEVIVNLEKGEAEFSGDVALETVKDVITKIGFKAP